MHGTPDQSRGDDNEGRDLRLLADPSDSPA